MPEFDIKLPDVLGWIMKWLLICLSICAVAKIVIFVAEPLMGNINHLFDGIHRNPMGLGALCLILIAIVGIMRMFLRK